MNIGIDASNIRAGGGVTHLTRLLAALSHNEKDIIRIFVWGGESTLSKIFDHPLVIRIQVPMLDLSLPFRIIWQQIFLPKCLKKNGCDILFSPGGTLPFSLSIPSCLMSQNLLPFEHSEAARYGSIINFMRFKFMLLRRSQVRSIKNANGLIFLTRYAQNIVLSVVGSVDKSITIIPHGIEKRFFKKPRRMLVYSSFSEARPFRVLYVSNIDVYKHQWHVSKAIASLRKKGIPVEINFIGSKYPIAFKRFKQVIEKLDPKNNFLHYLGVIPFEKLHIAYSRADAFLFASSCENLPNILLEGMASGLPIACSNKGPMPEVLGDAGVYFDPERPDEIEEALSSLIKDPQLREHMAWEAYRTAKLYSWERCAKETVLFIKEVVRGSTCDVKEGN